MRAQCQPCFCETEVAAAQETWQWQSWTGRCREYFTLLSPSLLCLISAAVSSQHNSLWVTFVSKTFHPMKMFYLISKSSIFFVTDRTPYITMSGESLAVKLIRVDNSWIESEPFVFLPTSLPPTWEPFQEGESKKHLQISRRPVSRVALRSGLFLSLKWRGQLGKEGDSKPEDCQICSILVRPMKNSSWGTLKGCRMAEFGC